MNWTISKQVNHPVRVEFLGVGEEVTPNTMNKMKDIINSSIKDYYVRRWAEKIVENAGKDDYIKVDFIYNFLVSHVKYLKDPHHVELLKTPKVSLQLLEVGETPSLDCVSVDEEVICREKETGFYKLLPLSYLEDKPLQFDTLSYDFEKKKYCFEEIFNWVDKGSLNSYRVRFNNGNGASVILTGTHPLFALDSDRCVKLVMVKDLSKNDRVLSILKAPELALLNKNLDQLWVEGHYVAEGCNGRSIANDNLKLRNLLISKLKKLNLPHHPSCRLKHAYVLVSGPFRNYLKDNFGSTSYKKKFPQEYFSLPQKEIEVFSEGYTKGDGHTREDLNFTEYTTRSRFLAKELFFMNLILGKSSRYRIHLSGIKKGLTNRIRFPIKEFDRYMKSGRSSLYDYPGLKTVSIKKISEEGMKKVCSMTVSGFHNFFLWNGVMVKNCDCMAVLSLSLIKSIGIPVALRATSYKPDGKFSHVYGLVFIKPKGWVPFDLVKFQGLGWEAPNMIRVLDMEV